MTEGTILSLTVALVTGIPPTIMALAAYRQSRAAALAAAKTEVKAEGIAKSVDGAATEMRSKNEALVKEVALMREVLAKNEQTAALLAQAAVTRPAETPAMAGSAPAASLVQIDKNTEETARNTERTDATVQDLKEKA